MLEKTLHSDWFLHTGNQDFWKVNSNAYFPPLRVNRRVIIIEIRMPENIPNNSFTVKKTNTDHKLKDLKGLSDVYKVPLSLQSLKNEKNSAYLNFHNYLQHAIRKGETTKLQPP